jgi:glycosyltransferase involved in cell wall biosynthesis
MGADTLIVKTIDHDAHEAFWEGLDADSKKYKHYENYILRYAGAFEFKNYDSYIVENLLPLAYLKYNPRFRSNNLYSVVADGLPYVYKERPDWYYNTDRQGLKIPKRVKNFYLEEVKRGLANLDGAIVVSPLLKQHLEDIYEGPIKICPPSHSEDKIFHLKKREPAQNNSIFSVVRNSEWKGLNLLLDAFEIAKKDIADLELNLRIGDRLYQREKERLEQEDINLHRNWVSTEKYAELFSNNKVYVQSSYFDPHSIAVAEAMIAGLTPIVTEGVGAKQLLENHPELVRNRSPEDIAEGIIQQLNEEPMPEKMREKSLELHPDKITKKFKEKINELKTQ